MHRPPGEPLPRTPAPTIPTAPIPEEQEPVDPRQEASLQLSNQGRILLEKQRYDDAIRILERAISLYPQNGTSYFYMAEAWLAKGSFKQAGEFNRLAEMYLEADTWSSKILKQRSAINSQIKAP